jgi:hypothetical protein
MARWPLWLKIALGLIGLVVGLLAFLFLGWACFPILGILLAFSARARDRLLARLPAAGRLRPGVLGVIVTLAGLFAWGVAISILPKSSGPAQTTAQPTTTAGPSPTVAVAIAPPAATNPATAMPTVTRVPATPTEAATQTPAASAQPGPAPTEPSTPPAVAVAPSVPAPATSAPAPKATTSGGARPVGTSCPPGFLIKGNQGSRSTTEWIYHLPGGASYAVTAPEECFATEAAAQAAGYRRALR